MLRIPISPSSSTQARISILIAARDEEKNIGACLEAILKLRYPKELLEIWVGNDDSSDKTAEIVGEYSRMHPHIHLLNISQNIGTARGKANVLAHLAHKGSGEYFFVTDADIRVPENWIDSLLKHFTPETGIVSGCTYSIPSNWLGQAQQLDWVFAFGMVTVVSDLKIPVSAVGNNMAIRKEAYFSTGGYEKIPFSVTEDQELFFQTLKKGWTFRNLFNAECLAQTEPIPDWKQLLKQRRRWMSGAMKIPPVLLLCLFLQGVALPMIIVSLLYSPFLGILCWGSKIVLQQLFMWQCFRKLKLHYSVFTHLPLFEFYSMVLSPIVVMQYFLIRKVEWKGRIYT